MAKRLLQNGKGWTWDFFIAITATFFNILKDELMFDIFQ